MGSTGKFVRKAFRSIRIRLCTGRKSRSLHPKGLTCEGWYTTGTSPEACEQGAKIPISPLQIQADGKCVQGHEFAPLHI